MDYCTTEIALEKTICEGENYELGGMTFSETGTFQVIVEDESSCLGSIEYTLNLTVGEIPLVSLGDTIFLTLGESATLSPGTGFSAYLWSTGSEEESIEIFADDLGSGESEITVEVQTEFGCSGNSSVIVVVLEPSSITELEKTEFKIFPNPATDQLFIEMDHNVSLEKYNIYTYDGSLIMSVEVKNHQLLGINISMLPKGQYFLRAFGKNDNITRKFLKF
jgi:hypothetical protein